MSDTQNPKMVTLMPDYINSTISYSSFKIIITVVIVVLAIMVLCAMLGGGFTANRLQIINLNKKYDTSRFKKTNLIPTLHGEFAAVKSGSFPHNSNGTDFDTKESCENVNYRVWDPDTQKCLCKDPYWGTSCQREANGYEYLSMGHFEKCGSLDIIGEYLVNNKSFPHMEGYETCQEHCDKDDRCVGFIYNELGDRNSSSADNHCITLKSEPTGDVKYDITQDGNLYLHKSRSSLLHRMPHKVFLIKGDPPRRFWMEPHIKDDIYAITEIGFNTAHRVSFIPSTSINHSKAPIVFSTRYFTTREANHAVEVFKSTGRQTEDMFIHVPGENDLILPYTWLGSDYWVMAVSDEQCGRCTSSKSEQSISASNSIVSGYRTSSITMSDCSDYGTLSASRPDVDETMFKSEWSL